MLERLWHPDCGKSLIGYGPSSLSKDRGPEPCKQVAAGPKLLISTPGLGARFSLRSFHQISLAKNRETGYHEDSRNASGSSG